MANPRIRAFKKAARADIMGDARATSSQLDAVFQNLRTGAQGVRANLTAAQARELGALNRLASRGTAKANAQLERARAGAVNRYGSAMGGVVETGLRPAAAVKAGTVLNARGLQKAGEIVKATGQDALALQEGATEQAAAAADYAMAVAMRSRFQASAETVAQMRFELQQQRIDHRQAMEMAEYQAELQWKYRELEIEKLQEAEQTSPEVTGGLTAASMAAANSFPNLQKLFWKDVNGNYPSAAEVAKTYITNNNIQDPNAIAFINAIATSMEAAGAGPEAAGNMSTDPAVRQSMVIDSIVETMIAMYPQYADHAETIRNYLEAQGNAQFSLWTAGVLGNTDPTDPTAPGPTDRPSGLTQEQEQFLESRYVPMPTR